MTPVEIVNKQLEYYNKCDIDGFCSTYTDDIEVIDGAGKTVVKGLEDLRTLYGKLFKENPDQMAMIYKRITVDNRVMDEEHVVGRADGIKRRAIAMYRVRDGKISHVQLIAKPFE
ncbi:MAG: nuclear transport factor 2 family protein [Planctomycetota bacterium]|jgi:hypothetical protein